MFNFNLKTAAIYRAVKWEKNPIFRFAGIKKKLFSNLFILTFLFFLYSFFTESFSQNLNSKLFGFSIVFLVLSISGWLKETFFNSKLKQPRLRSSGFGGQVSGQVGGQAKPLDEAIENPEKFNLAEFLSFEVAKAAEKSMEFARTNKIEEIDSSILFYFLLKDNPKLNFVFLRALLDLNEIKKILESQFSQSRVGKAGASSNLNYSQDFQDSILEALKLAQKREHQRIEIGDIIPALSRFNPVFRQILIEADLKSQDLESLTWWLESLESKIKERKKFWEYKNLAKKGSIAKDWAAGYTINLDRYSIDWTELIRQKGFEEIIGHKKTIEQLERILSRLEVNNALIVGEAGMGRGAMVQALAQKCLFGETLPEINYKRVVELDMVSLISRTKTQKDLEATLDLILQEAVLAGNVILVINEFHNYVGEEIRPGVIDISGILEPYLKLSRFQIVAITTFAGLHKNIEQNPSILALFEKVEVSEISREETIIILENLALVLELKYKKFVTYPAIKEIIYLTSRYLPAVPFPKKAIDALDEVMVYVSSLAKEKIVLPEHVQKVISEKIAIPVGKIEIKEKEILLNLESLIHKRIINQAEAVKEVSDALRRARADITVRKGPMGCFLFLGPTGVGKTETSKAMSEIYFGSEERMIRLDMSEFQDVKDIPRLLGSPGQEGLLTTPVRENPFSLILLDEIEKAHPNILNLFLQVLDEGHVTDGLGRKVDFKNAIIIATSNAGYLIILEAIKKKVEWSEVKNKLLDFLFKEGAFRPELINRFDAVVVFRPLSKENLLDITELLLQKLKQNLKEKEIDFIITEPLKEKIVELGYDPIFGARQLRRVIQDKVENILAKAILSGELKRGNRAEIEAENFGLKINP